MFYVKRVQKELADVEKDKHICGVRVKICNQNLMHMRGTIEGPVDSPYEGGIFVIKIHLPVEYPFKPPKMQFVTRVWHPNISSQTGAICLDILKDKWSPALTLKTTLISLQALLSTPEPRSPQDAVVAQQYLRDYSAFCDAARNWTQTFARPIVKEKVAKLLEMGSSKDASENALQKRTDDVSAASER